MMFDLLFLKMLIQTKYYPNNNLFFLHLFQKQNQILTSLSTIIELNAKINAYDEGKIKENDLKDYINDLYDQSFNVLQDPSISD